MLDMLRCGLMKISKNNLPTEPVPVTNTRKPVQKSTGFTYMPMSTDQAVELYRKQRYNF